MEPEESERSDRSEDRTINFTGSTEPEVPKIPANGELPTSSGVSIPVPSPASSSAPTQVANSSLIEDSPEKKPMGANADPGSSYLNGGIIERLSYSGSMASESMDLSVHRENTSISARVSQHRSKLSVLKGIHMIHLLKLFKMPERNGQRR